MSKRPSTLTRAIHEAGHAVAAIMFSIRFDDVTIEPHESGEGGSVRGFAQYAPNYVNDPETKDEPESLAFWQNMMVVCLAGPAAHKRCQRANWRGYAVGDLQEVFRLINDIHRYSGKKVREAYYKFIEALASELVEKFWSRVEALATALVERGTLTHAEVCFIVTGCPWKPIKLLRDQEAHAPGARPLHETAYGTKQRIAVDHGALPVPAVDRGVVA